MNYLIVVAVQFFRWALAWVARELVLLIVLALVSNFFSEFRALLLTFMDFVKDKVVVTMNSIGHLSNEVQSRVLELVIKLDNVQATVTDFRQYLDSKVAEILARFEQILNFQLARINRIIDTKVIRKLDEIYIIIAELDGVEQKIKDDLLTKVKFARANAKNVKDKGEILRTKITTTAINKLTQIKNQIPNIPNINTTDLTEQMQELTDTIVQGHTAMTDEIDRVFDTFTEEQVRSILEAQINIADDDIFDSASDFVSGKIKKKIKTPRAKKIKWQNLDHNKKASTSHAKKFKLNDIYRILVENFDRDERIALALRFAKKDHFRLKR